MRPLSAPLALLAAFLPLPLAAQEAVETPYGLARIEGDAYTEGGLRLMVGDRELLRSEDDYFAWVEEAAGDLLLVAFSEGGTACAALWRVVDARTGVASELFGTCSDGARVTAAKDGKVTVTMGSNDFDHPTVDFIYDGATVTQIPRGQEPAALPPGTPGEQWIGRWSSEFWIASDWREPLVALLGEETYHEAQAAFTRSMRIEAEGDWAVGTGCVQHACDILEGVIAVHRTDGRVIVALSSESHQYGYQSWVWGETMDDDLPPTMADMIWGDEEMP